LADSNPLRRFGGAIETVETAVVRSPTGGLATAAFVWSAGPAHPAVEPMYRAGEG